MTLATSFVAYPLLIARAMVLRHMPDASAISLMSPCDRLIFQKATFDGSTGLLNSRLLVVVDIMFICSAIITAKILTQLTKVNSDNKKN